MKENKEVKISYWAAHLTTVVSVTLVLFLVGLVALAWIGADMETRRLKEKIELSVIMADSVPDTQAQALARDLASRPYTAKAGVITKQQALDDWTAQTGENLEELFGINPLSPEVTLSLKADFASAARIDSIAAGLRALPGVESVSSPDASMVDSMNHNLGRFSLILAAFAIIMLAISFVLINNTVHLTIYSRRFTIHTMQLVGATNAFIRRPVIVNNALSGLLSGVLAAGFMALVVVGGSRAGVIDAGVPRVWEVYAVIAAGLVLLGIILCSLAAWIAANRYLRKDYDELFK